MKRFFILLLGICFLFAGADLYAGKKKKGKKKKKKQKSTEVTVAPTSEQIDPMIEEFDWGMTHEEVLKILSKKIEDKYRKKMAKTSDPINEDQYYKQMQAKIKLLKKGYVEFTGQVTGYDSSLVNIEYTHKNDESMIVFPKDSKMGRKWDDYFFFINDRLWKIFRAFDADMFPGLQWTDVQGAMSTKFGAKPLEMKKFDPDTKLVNVIGLQWQDSNTLLSLLDYTTFFGIFCLRFEDHSTLAQIDTLRVNKPPSKGGSSIVDAITEGTSADGSEDIVDQMTKKSHKDKKTYKKKGKSTYDDDDDYIPPPKKDPGALGVDDIY